MSRPAPIHICFYSNRCDWSKAFITEISQTNYHKEFRFICVDPSPNRAQLPSWLKQTPTLVISGDPEPKVNSDVMNWLYERKMKDGGGGAKSVNGTIQQVSSEPEPYIDSEMGNNIGDNYSFVNSDWSTNGNGGLSIAHNFSFLNGSTSVGTKEASSFQTTSSNQKRSKKEELLDQQMEAFKRDREIGIPQRVSRQ
jgi:hypothetical protein